MAAGADKASFWDHLDVLRAVILRCVAVAVALGVVAFLFKEELFAILLAPKDPDFVTYRLLGVISGLWGGGGFGSFEVELLNTWLAGQFVIHVRVAMSAGVVAASPYIIYQLFRFVSPALYVNERRYAIKAVGGGYVMFVLGLLLCYFLVFPLTFRFLGTYQVSGEVQNMISLQSYVSTFMAMSVAMGVVFEIPMLAWLFARLGLLSSAVMRRYRKHAIVVIGVIAAVITPTSDIFTMLMVATPMCLLYEAGIAIVKRTERGRADGEENGAGDMPTV